MIFNIYFHHNGQKVLGYVDDLVILVQGKYNNVVRGGTLTRWTDEWLNISLSKSTIIAFIKRTKLEGLGPLKF